MAASIIRGRYSARATTNGHFIERRKSTKGHLFLIITVKIVIIIIAKEAKVCVFL